MKKFLSALFKHPIIVGVIVPVISPVVVALVKSISINQAFFVIFGWLKAFFTFGIPVWVILVSLGILCAIVYLLVKISDNRTGSGSSGPKIQNYRADIIEGIRWHWRCQQNYDGTYSVGPDDLMPICPRCKNDLIPTQKMDGYLAYSPIGFYCDHCHFTQKFTTGSYESFLEKVVREIIRRSRTHEWEKALMRLEDSR